MDGAARGTILASWTQNLVHAAGVCGLDQDALLARAGLRAEDLNAPGGRVPYGKHRRLWSAMEELGAAPDFGLRLARVAMQSNALDITGYILQNCHDLGELIIKFREYGRLINEAPSQLFYVDGQVAVMVVARVLGEELHRYSADHTLATYLLLARAWLEKPVHVVSVSFASERPTDVSLYEEVFGAPLQFSAPRGELRFARSSLQNRLKRSDPALREHLEPRAKELLGKLEHGPFLERVRQLLPDALGTGRCDVENVSHLLGMSPRTFQRRLGELGTSFQVVLDEERRALALRALDNPNFSVKECAHVAGFTSGAAFSRAVSRWTQQTPLEYRRRQGP